LLRQACREASIEEDPDDVLDLVPSVPICLLDQVAAGAPRRRVTPAAYCPLGVRLLMAFAL
jgi:hypothetical protein